MYIIYNYIYTYIYIYLYIYLSKYIYILYASEFAECISFWLACL